VASLATRQSVKFPFVPERMPAIPLREVMDSLPGFGSDSRIDSRNLGPTGQTVSQPVTEIRELKTKKSIANKGESHDLTAAVPVCHSEPESGGFGIRIPLSPPAWFY